MRRSPMLRRVVAAAAATAVSSRPSAAVLLVRQALERTEAPRASAGPSNREHVAKPKEGIIQHEGYMNVVRRMACMRCRRPPPSQFCHADFGKGEALKTDCRRGWPGCADRPGEIGCHTLIGSTGTLTRQQRRELEEAYGADTRAAVRAAGLWPADLGEWLE